jgi:hypothetical protein
VLTKGKEQVQKDSSIKKLAETRKRVTIAKRQLTVENGEALAGPASPACSLKFCRRRGKSEMSQG